MDYKKVYEEWLSDEYFDESTRAELESIKDNDDEIRDRFGAVMKFGTAGLRGIIGAGTNRINRYVVRKTTQGLADYIISQGKKDRGVAIAFDSRRMSPEFALEAALTLAGNGVKAYLFESLRPTPELSFAVRHLNCAAGINITASHNPAEYNGYKVYWEDGAQITPPHDVAITESVAAVDSFDKVKVMDEDEAKEKGLLQIIGEDIDRVYIDTVKSCVLHMDAIEEMGDKIKIVYTPLHGTGNIPVRRVLDELGFKNVFVVPEQELPDGNFPTVGYPNPESEAAFELGLKYAKEQGADLVLATDPDADRLGVRVKDKEGNYHDLTGNMSGSLICEYELSSRKEISGIPEDGVIVKTIVTTNLTDEIAKYYGVEQRECLTGFKYIGQQILDMEKTGRGTYLFGFEESYGCLIGTYARDKDAVSATTALCEAAAYYATKGKTLWDVMLDIYEKYGYFREGVASIEKKGLDGIAEMGRIIANLRENAPMELGGSKVLKIRDYDVDEIKDLATGEVTPTGLPKSNVLYYELEDGAWVCVRPSGTEPKLKFYFGIKGSDANDADAKAATMQEALYALAGN